MSFTMMLTSAKMNISPWTFVLYSMYTVCSRSRDIARMHARTPRARTYPSPLAMVPIRPRPVAPPPCSRCALFNHTTTPVLQELKTYEYDTGMIVHIILCDCIIIYHGDAMVYVINATGAPATWG